MDRAASEAVYQFEGFALDLARGALLDPKGVEVPLRAKSFELLRLFVVSAGRLLDRDTINQAIWADVVVTDDAITQCVRDIRRALGDEAQPVIKTVPRRGYVFAADVTNATVKQPKAATVTEVMPLPDRPSIAVWPFANLSAIRSKSISPTAWRTTSSPNYPAIVPCLSLLGTPASLIAGARLM